VRPPPPAGPLGPYPGPPTATGVDGMVGDMWQQGEGVEVAGNRGQGGRWGGRGRGGGRGAGGRGPKMPRLDPGGSYGGGGSDGDAARYYKPSFSQNPWK
jgi:hypothetical protein